MNEPLGIALELAARRKALAARMSPQARRLAFPDVYRVEEERRAEIKYRIKKIKSDWSAGKHVTSREKAIAMQPQTQIVTKTCARIWQVPVGQIYDAARLQIYVLPRRASMALMRDLLDMTLPAIGVTLNRDHTSCMYAVQKHEETYDCNPDYRRKYDEAEAELRFVFKRNVATSDTATADDEVDAVAEPASHPSSADMKEAA